jgi:hypothetical protein
LRTNLVVDTPTLAVCGATGFADLGTDRVEGRQQQRRKPKNLAHQRLELAEHGIVEVLLPDRATPIHPRIGATRMKATPILENPLASEAAMPE